MLVSHATSHQESTVALFRQLQREKMAADIDAAVVARHERLLRLHLHVLARCEPEFPAKGAAEVFVGLASHLSSPETQVRSEGYRLAYELLARGGVHAEGAFAALSLFPEYDPFTPLDLYRTHEALRPVLFDLWREQERAVPVALLSRAELQGDDTLQLAALGYAAGQPAIGIELFRSYYQPLQTSVGPRVSGKLLTAALWGGMQRGERDTGRLLRRGIEGEADPQTRLELLRLGALSADPELLPVLRQLLQERPEQGARLLALHGTREAVDLLVEALASAATLAGVAQSWPRVSGERLPQTARLRVVGEGDSPGQGSMPDAAAASTWWLKRRPSLKEEERLLYGAAATLPHLLRLAGTRAGAAGRDLLDLLALQLGRPLGVTAHTEQLRRRTALRQAASAAPAAEHRVETSGDPR